MSEKARRWRGGGGGGKTGGKARGGTRKCRSRIPISHDPLAAIRAPQYQRLAFSLLLFIPSFCSLALRIPKLLLSVALALRLSAGPLQRGNHNYTCGCLLIACSPIPRSYFTPSRILLLPGKTYFGRLTLELCGPLRRFRLGFHLCETWRSNTDEFDW